MLLFPDPRPLVERLGPEFFRLAPESPGVYLMRDSADIVVYVGKAKNLRKRLASYRVANPDRVPRRRLRLLRTVERIELQACDSEEAALAREANLLRSLRPRYNRAGTWPGNVRFLVWRLTDQGLEIELSQTAYPDCQIYGPLGARGEHLCAALARLLWCGLHPHGGTGDLPQGWFAARPARALIPRRNAALANFENLTASMKDLFSGQPESFIEWSRASTASWTHPFDLAVREGDLEMITEFGARASRQGT